MGKKAGFSIRHPILLFVSVRLLSGSLNNSNVPPDLFASVVIIFIIVVLPAPFLPISPYISPFSIVMSTWSSAAKSLYILVRPFVFKTISFIGSSCFLKRPLYNIDISTHGSLVILSILYSYVLEIFRFAFL